MTTLPEKDPADILINELRAAGWGRRDDGRREETPEIFTYRKTGTKSSNRLVWTALLFVLLLVAYLFFS